MLPQRDFQFAYVVEDDPHIGGYCRMNSGGPNWSLVDSWKAGHFVLHLAGKNFDERNASLQEYSKQFSETFGMDKCLGV
jgi:hypothetical protein